MKIKKDKFYIYKGDKSFIVRVLESTNNREFSGEIIWVDRTMNTTNGYYVGYKTHCWVIDSFYEINENSVVEEITSSNPNPYIIKGLNNDDLCLDEDDLYDFIEKHFPVGTTFYDYNNEERIVFSKPIFSGVNDSIVVCSENINGDIIIPDIYNSKDGWVKKKEIQEIEKIQRLPRKGLKEIHSVVKSSFKNVLEQYGTRNPLEDYVELTNDEVNLIFKEFNNEELSIVSKYLKQDDNSVNLSNVRGDGDGIRLHDLYILRVNDILCDNKSFWLNQNYNWEIKNKRLIPTIKN